MNINRILKQFVIKAACLFVIWNIVYYGFILPYTNLNPILTRILTRATQLGLELVGFESGIGENINETGRIASTILIENQEMVIVADSCNGMELFALFVGFLLAFPGKMKYKAPFMILGVMLIFLINTLREIILVLNYKFYADSFHFNHKYTYVLIVYSFVFLLWRFWLNKFSILSPKK